MRIKRRLLEINCINCGSCIWKLNTKGGRIQVAIFIRFKCKYEIYVMGYKFILFIQVYMSTRHERRKIRQGNNDRQGWKIWCNIIQYNTKNAIMAAKDERSSAIRRIMIERRDRCIPGKKSSRKLFKIF